MVQSQLAHAPWQADSGKSNLHAPPPFLRKITTCANKRNPLACPYPPPKPAPKETKYRHYLVSQAPPKMQPHTHTTLPHSSEKQGEHPKPINRSCVYVRVPGKGREKKRHKSNGRVSPCFPFLHACCTSHTQPNTMNQKSILCMHVGCGGWR